MNMPVRRLEVVNAHEYHGAGEYVGRPHPRFPQGSVLGNPYHLGQDGSRSEVIARYRRWLRRQWLTGGAAKAELLRLAEQAQLEPLRLICWCKPADCHADHIATALREILGQERPDLTGPPWLLVTGSREATPAMLTYARRIVVRAKELGWSIVVGDADGVDAAVIDTCDELGVWIEVHGAHNHLRQRTRTGRNIVHTCSYPARDRRMADRADRCLAIWNGTSHGTSITFEYARQLGMLVDVKHFKAER